MQKQALLRKVADRHGSLSDKKRLSLARGISAASIKSRPTDDR